MTLAIKFVVLISETFPKKKRTTIENEYICNEKMKRKKKNGDYRNRNAETLLFHHAFNC